MLELQLSPGSLILSQLCQINRQRVPESASTSDGQIGQDNLFVDQISRRRLGNTRKVHR